MNKPKLTPITSKEDFMAHMKHKRATEKRLTGRESRAKGRAMAVEALTMFADVKAAEAERQFNEGLWKLSEAALDTAAPAASKTLIQEWAKVFMPGLELLLDRRFGDNEKAKAQERRRWKKLVQERLRRCRSAATSPIKLEETPDPRKQSRRRS